MTVLFVEASTTAIYPLSLHDALPICDLRDPPGRGGDSVRAWGADNPARARVRVDARSSGIIRDRKSTRLNSSHGYISYAAFCLKKKIAETRKEAVPRHIQHRAKLGDV